MSSTENLEDQLAFRASVLAIVILALASIGCADNAADSDREQDVVALSDSQGTQIKLAEPHPTPSHLPLPLEFPERLIALSDPVLIAEVEVAELYAVTGNTSDGVVPTRPPNLAFAAWEPSTERMLWTPVRLLIQEVYLADEPPGEGVLVAGFLGYAADFQPPQEVFMPGWDTTKLHVGDRGLIILDRHGGGVLGVIWSFLAGEAGKLSADGQLHTAGYNVTDFYQYADDMAHSHRGPGHTISVDRLTSRLREFLSTSETISPSRRDP